MDWRLLRRNLVVLYVVTLCLGLVVFSFYSYSSEKNKNEIEKTIVAENVLSRYLETELRTETSLWSVSRSVYVFDTVMSKEDYASRFLYNILKADDVIKMSRVVVDDNVFGDDIPDQLDRWYTEVRDRSKLVWSDVYTYEGSTLRDLYSPVFYNQKVVGFVSYSVSVPEMFEGVEGMDYAYYDGDTAVFETVTYADHLDAWASGSVEKGKGKIEYVYRDVQLLNVMKDSVTSYVVVCLLWTSLFVLIGMFIRSVCMRREMLTRDVNRILSQGSEDEFSKEILGRSYMADEYGMLKELRDRMDDLRKEEDLTEKLKISEGRLSDARESNRKLRDIYIRTKQDMVLGVERYDVLNEDFVSFKEKYRLVEDERDGLKQDIISTESELYDRRMEVEKYRDVIERVYRIADAFYIEGSSVSMGNDESNPVMDGLEYRLRLVIAELYSQGVYDAGIGNKVDYMIEKLESCIYDVDHIRNHFGSLEESMDELIDRKRYDDEKVIRMVEEIKRMVSDDME